MLVFSNGLSAAGGAALLFYGLDHEKHWSFPVLIFVSKFGIACSLNTLFVAHNAIFPLLFSATSLGIVNVLSRTACALSPLFSTFVEPIPMIAFTSTCGLTSLLALCLQVELE